MIPKIILQIMSVSRTRAFTATHVASFGFNFTTHNNFP